MDTYTPKTIAELTISKNASVDSFCESVRQGKLVDIHGREIAIDKPTGKRIVLIGNGGTFQGTSNGGMTVPGGDLLSAIKRLRLEEGPDNIIPIGIFNVDSLEGNSGTINLTLEAQKEIIEITNGQIDGFMFTTGTDDMAEFARRLALSWSEVNHKFPQMLISTNSTAEKSFDEVQTKMRRGIQALLTAIDQKINECMVMGTDRRVYKAGMISKDNPRGYDTFREYTNADILNISDDTNHYEWVFAPNTSKYRKNADRLATPFTDWLSESECPAECHEFRPKGPRAVWETMQSEVITGIDLRGSSGYPSDSSEVIRAAHEAGHFIIFRAPTLNACEPIGGYGPGANLARLGVPHMKAPKDAICTKGLYAVSKLAPGKIKRNSEGLYVFDQETLHALQDLTRKNLAGEMVKTIES